MRMRYFIFGVLGFALTACSGLGQWEPVPGDPNTQIVAENAKTGVKYIKSKQPSSIVAVSQLRNEDQTGWGILGLPFDVKVANLGTSAVTFGPKNIRF
jgi:hypothetical protein